MKKHLNQLQSVFACLATHSKWVKSARTPHVDLSQLFNLSENEADLLQRFLQLHGKSLWISALLGEEKRWRELLAVIKHTKNLLGEHSLKQYWRDYLQTFTIDQPIPHNPLEEAVQFLDFLKCTSPGLLGKNIIEYDYLQNSVLLFEFNQPSAIPALDYHHCENNGVAYVAELNPSFIYKQFDITISELIKNSELDKPIMNIPKSEPECIAFYKSPKSNLVKSSKLSDRIKTLLSQLHQYANLADFTKAIIHLHGLNLQDTQQFIKKLSDADIIFLSPIQKDHHA